MRPRFLLLLAAAAFGTGSVSAYTFTSSHWATSTIPMQLQLGATSNPLSDGSTSWGASAEDALMTWNSYIRAARFTVVRDSTAPIAQGNRTNNVFFGSTVYGDAWGTGVLAITLTYSSSSGQTSETDVLFNGTLSWDSYRGAQHYGSSGAVYDFHRVALHEFGHVLGLDHPDQAGQSVVAIMNSRISNLDALATDDISGAQAIYGANSGATVGTAPVITTSPSSQTVTAGATVSFAVTVSSSTAVSYQWAKNGTPVFGATNASLTLTGVTTASAGDYNVTVANVTGSVTSASARLTVNPAPAPTPTPTPTPVPTPPPAPAYPPTITSQPASRAVNQGDSATLAVTASGTAPLSYSWRKDGAAIAGATQSSYTVGPVAAKDAGTYTVVVGNNVGSVTSSAAVLTVNTPPVLSTLPTNQTVSVGNRFVLSVSATGSPAPTYQWLKNGSTIAGATSSTLVVASATPTDSGTYSVVVANSAGYVTTVPVLVTVTYSQLVNLSTRGFVPGGAALTAGFVVRGTAEKPVIVRGIGPALDGFGVTGTLANPQLAIISQDSSQTIAVNNDWNAAPQLSTAFQTVGAFALPNGSADSASEVRLAPGGFTTRITSASDAAGIALAEVYDADAPAAGSRLVNLSTLGFTGPGDQTLVGGFSIAGNTAKRVLIRAVGPGLAPYAVAGALADPTLSVFRLGDSTPLAANDNWPATDNLPAVFSAAGAFQLPAGSRDAAVVLSLPAGGYTVTVSGAGDTAGYVLLEIYDLDP